MNIAQRIISLGQAVVVVLLRKNKTNPETLRGKKSSQLSADTLSKNLTMNQKNINSISTDNYKVHILKSANLDSHSFLSDFFPSLLPSLFHSHSNPPTHLLADQFTPCSLFPFLVHLRYRSAVPMGCVRISKACKQILLPSHFLSVLLPTKGRSSQPTALRNPPSTWHQKSLPLPQSPSVGFYRSSHLPCLLPLFSDHPLLSLSPIHPTFAFTSCALLVGSTAKGK